MKKRVQKQVRRNIHIFADQHESQAGSKGSFESLREMVGLIATGAGIFAALLYLAGRSFASGYFEAMNIPNYQVNFSIWEYGEVAWRPMIFYPTLMLGVSSLIWTIVFGLRDLITPRLKHIAEWLRNTIKARGPAWLRPEFSKQTLQWFAVTIFAFLIFLFMQGVESTLKFVEEWGRRSGQINVVEKALQVELISAIPMGLDDNNLPAVRSSGQDYFVYKGFHLLTFNNGKYYLFKEIDTDTCRPVKVYVIEAGQSLQVNLLPAVSLANQCNKTAITDVVTTPATVVPTP